MTGRMHEGNEKGSTKYEYATLKAVDKNGKELKGGVIEVSPLFQRETASFWTKPIKESAGIWAGESSSGTVIVGRKHSGDENGSTSYMLAHVLYNNNLCHTGKNIKHEYAEFGNNAWEVRVYEAEGIFYKTANGEVLVQRMHSGNEKKASFYRQEALYVLDTTTQILGRDKGRNSGDSTNGGNSGTRRGDNGGGGRGR
jgi:hypothetical protein